MVGIYKPAIEDSWFRQEFMGDSETMSCNHLDEERNAYFANLIIYSKHRMKGFGKQCLGLLLYAAKKNGIERLHGDMMIDNLPSSCLGITVLLKNIGQKKSLC